MLETLLGPKEEDRRRSSESSSEGNRSDDLTPEVRVTPSQFLKLAEGAQRWDAHHAKDPDNVSTAFPLIISSKPNPLLYPQEAVM